MPILACTGGYYQSNGVLSIVRKISPEEQSKNNDLVYEYKNSINESRDVSRFVTQHLNYTNNLTHKRLIKHKVRLKESFTRAKENIKIQMSFNDGKNISFELWDSDNREKVYTNKSSKTKLKDKHNRKFIFVSSKASIGEEIRCSNCGAPSKQEQLLAGCPYCGTSFNFEEYSTKLAHIIPLWVGERGMKSFKKLTLLISLIITTMSILRIEGIEEIVSEFFSGVATIVSGGNLLSLFSLEFLGMIFIIAIVSVVYLAIIYIVSYMIATILMIPKLFANVAKEYWTNRVQWKMQKTDEFFSRENFIGIALQRFKVWALSDSAEMLQLTSQMSANNPNYIDVGIVEYRGTKTIRRGNCATILLKAEAVFVKCKNGKLTSYNRNVHMKFARNYGVKTQFKIDFEILECRGCGATISILEGGICKYCGNWLDIKDYDWVLVDIGVKRISIIQKLFH